MEEDKLNYYKTLYFSNVYGGAMKGDLLKVRTRFAYPLTSSTSNTELYISPWELAADYSFKPHLCSQGGVLVTPTETRNTTLYSQYLYRPVVSQIVIESSISSTFPLMYYYGETDSARHGTEIFVDLGRSIQCKGAMCMNLPYYDIGRYVALDYFVANDDEMAHPAYVLYTPTPQLRTLFVTCFNYYEVYMQSHHSMYKFTPKYKCNPYPAEEEIFDQFKVYNMTDLSDMLENFETVVNKYGRERESGQETIEISNKQKALEENYSEKQE